MKYKQLKRALEQALGIIQWSPAEHQLADIAHRLRNYQGTVTRDVLWNIVAGVLGDIPQHTLCMEGVDHSDLTLVLRMATLHEDE